MDVCIIPARMGSSRYPGKPMIPILGMPMIEHVYRRSAMGNVFSKVYVATCDHEIADFCQAKDIPFVMTSDSHERASDRVQEAAKKIEKVVGRKLNTVTMVQGDEPMVTPKMLKFAIESLKSAGASVVNLRSAITDSEELHSPNCVKVVVGVKDNALYFSRSAIPNTAKFKGEVKRFKQVCIIPFTRDFLDVYSSLEPTPLEIVESVDMNRVIEHGFSLFCPEINEESYPVDVPSDVVRVEKYLKKDPLVPLYLK